MKKKNTTTRLLTMCPLGAQLCRRAEPLQLPKKAIQFLFDINAWRVRSTRVAVEHANLKLERNNMFPQTGDLTCSEKNQQVATCVETHHVARNLRLARKEVPNGSEILRCTLRPLKAEIPSRDGRQGFTHQAHVADVGFNNPRIAQIPFATVDKPAC